MLKYNHLSYRDSLSLPPPHNCVIQLPFMSPQQPPHYHTQTLSGKHDIFFNDNKDEVVGFRRWRAERRSTNVRAWNCQRRSKISKVVLKIEMKTRERGKGVLGVKTDWVSESVRKRWGRSKKCAIFFCLWQHQSLLSLNSSTLCRTYFSVASSSYCSCSLHLLLLFSCVRPKLTLFPDSF